MSRARPDRQDFRAAAVAESLRLLGQAGGDPLGAGVSYCLPVGPEDAAATRRARRQTIASLVGALALLAAAMVLMVANRPGGGPPASGGTPAGDARLVAALACMVGSMAFMFAPTILQRRHTRRVVTARFGGTPWVSDTRPITVNIEDAQTHARLKVLPEDMGMMMLYADPGCVQIEGVRYRYLIHAPDVISVTAERPASTESVTIRYRVGGAQLGLTLFQTSLLSETRRQLVGGNALYRRVRAVLGQIADASPIVEDAAKV